jgi:hypothetical protein
MDIVRQLVRNDGGEGTVQEVVPGEHGLGIFNTLLREPESFDATWVFMPWEVREGGPTRPRQAPPHLSCCPLPSPSLRHACPKSHRPHPSP